MYSVLCVVCCFIILCHGTSFVLLYYLLCYCILLFYSAVHCYLFFCVLVMYVSLTVYIVL